MPHHPDRSLAALVAAGALLLAAASPAAALTISGTTTKPRVADASTKDIIYYLDLHAGPQDERFSVAFQAPAFATRGGRDEGQAIDGPRQITLVGDPGTVGQLITEPSIGAVCSDRDSAFHGYATGASTVDVALPANANTTLAVRYATGRRAPWVDTDLALRFEIQAKIYGTYPGTSPLFGAATAVDTAQNLRATVPVPVQSSGKTSRIGAHLLLKTSPSGTWGDTAAPRRVKRSASIRVNGQLLPELSGKRVQLQWRKGTGALRTATTVKTRKGGRFSARLKAPGKGTYELWAQYPSQSGVLVKDSTSCPLRYSVG